MSKTVDERIVSMQFDNKNFEKNVHTSLNTLEKFKQSLNLKGAAKGIDEVNAAAKRVDMTGITKGIENVQAKFSALQVMSVTALANITNAAVNAGKRIARSLTIDPIKLGFNEYELKMGSIQTIMASTGESLETVNKYLNELNEYSDKTIYSFSDMTQNIGKFTNAGVKLEDAVAAIKGISNEAALSGANANEASRAMYNFAQALSSGYVKLIDWKSIELANMATVDFKDQLIATALELGTITKKGDMYISTTKDLNGKVSEAFNSTKMFNDSLSAQWMTTDVLTTTLAKYADETTDIGKKASQAATEVKTFTMMMDTLKESAQSGWAQTWEIIFGDFNEGKSLWTRMSEIVGDYIQKASDARNQLLDGALSSKWDSLTKKIEETGVSTETFQEKLKETAKIHGIAIDELIAKEGSLANVMAKGKISKDIVIETIKKLAGVEQEAAKTTKKATASLEEFQSVVNKVIKGEFGDGADRMEALNKAGHNSVAIQKLVNKVWERNGKTFKNTTITAEDLAEVIGDLSESELKNIGYTKEQAEALKNLAKEAEKTGTPLNELIENLEKPSGRELLIDSARNGLQAITKLLNSVKKAWDNTFNPVTSLKLYNIIEGINKFTKTLIVSDETAEKIQHTFEGFFTVLRTIGTVAVDGLSVALKIAWSAFTLLGKALLTVTSIFGSAVSKIGSFGLKVFNPLSDTIQSFIDFLLRFVKSVENSFDDITKIIGVKVEEWKKKFKETKVFKTFSGYFEDGSKAIKNALTDLRKYLDNFSFGGILDTLQKVLNFFGGIILKIANSEFVVSIIDGIADAFKRFAGFIKKLKLPKIETTGIGNWFGKLENYFNENNISDFRGSITGFFGFLGSTIKYNWDNFKNNTLVKFTEWYLKFGDYIRKGFDAAKKVLSSIAEFIFGSKKIDLPTILDLTEKFLKIFVLLKTLSILNNFTGMFDSISDGLNNFAKAAKWRAIGEAFKSMAVALGVFAVCMIVIGNMKAEQAYRSAGILAGALVVMGGIIAGLIALSSKMGGSLNLASVVASILGISIALSILIGTLKRIDGMDFDNLGKSFAIMISVLMTMIGSIALVGKLCGGATFKQVAAILTLLTALSMVLTVLEKYREFPWQEHKAAIPKMMGMLLALAVAIRVATSGIKEGASASGTAMLVLSMVVSLKLLLSAIEDLGNMKTEKMWQGISGIVAILGAITAMLAIINVTNKGGKLSKGEKAINPFTGMAIALLAVSGAILLLGKMDTGTLLKGGSAVVVMLGMFALITQTMSKLGEAKTGNLIMMLVGFGLLLVEITVILNQLSSIGWRDALGSASSLVIVLGAMSACLLTLSKTTVNTKNIFQWLGAMGTMSLIVGVLANTLIAMASVNGLNAMAQVAALSTMLLAVGGCMAILSKINIDIKNAAIGIAALTVMAAPLAALVGVLALMSGVNDAIPNAKALAGLAVVLTGLLIPLTALGAIGLLGGGMGAAAIGIGIAALTLMAVPMITFVGVLAAMQGIQNASSNVVLLTNLMTTMTDLLVKVSLVAPLAVIGVAAMSAFTGIMMGIGVLAVGIGVLLDKFPQIEKFLETGIPIMERLAEGIGSMIGKFIAGFTSGVVSVLPYLGDMLSQFMSNASGFIEGAKKVNEKVLSGVAILAGSVLALTAVNFISGIASLIPMVGSLASLGAELSAFMIAVLPFISGAMQIKPEMLEGVRALADTILILTGANLLDGITSWVTGGSSLADFGKQVAFLGLGLAAFRDAIGNFSKKELSIVQCAADSVLSLAEAAEAIPNSGGWLGAIVGENDLDTFSEKFSALGEGLAAFRDSIGSFTDAEVALVGRAADAVVKLAEAASTIPNSGGWAGAIVGENDLDLFANRFPILATGLKEFVTNIGTFTDEHVSLVKRGADSVAAIAKAASKIPNSGGWVGAIVGNNDLDTFADQFPKLGTGLFDFVTNIGVFSEEQKATVVTACEAIKELAIAASKIPNSGGWAGAIVGENDLSVFADQFPKVGTGLSGFAKNLGTFDESKIDTINAGVKALNTVSSVSMINQNNINTLSGISSLLPNIGAKISEFSNKMAETGSISINSAIYNVSKIASMINNLEVNTDSASSFKKALKELGNSGLKKFVSAFTGEEAISKVSKAGKKMMDELVKGAKTKEEKMNKSFKTLGQKGANALGEKETAFVEAGKNLGDGLVKGINSKKEDAYNAGYALGERAAQGVSDGEDAHSPSRKSEKSGIWLGEGLIRGVSRMAGAVYNAAYGVGETATNAISKSIDKISNAINSDIDSQPTIRPILDLSNVKSGASAIAGMLNGRTLAYNTSLVGSISASMSGNQNGGNSDVISAIRDLGRKLSGSTGNVYNVNGVTYDDGTNVANAVGELIRAARIERRI